MLEEIGVFYRGLWLGLMIAAPLGPIALLCIRRTLQRGFVIGLATGLGAACADTLCGAVAALGVTAILDFMHHYDMFIRMVGGVALLIGAYHAWHDRPQPVTTIPNLLNKLNNVIHVQREYIWVNALKGLITGFGITVSNPVTIFAALAVVASLGHVENHLEAITLTTGVAFGSTLWWLILTGGVTLIRGLFSDQRIIMINRVTAAALAVIGVWAISSGVHRLLHSANPFG